MQQMSQDHEYEIKKLHAALDASRVDCSSLRDELSAATKHAAMIKKDLEGTRAALQLQRATAGQPSTNDLGLSQRQEDAICQEWETILEDSKTTHGAYIQELTNELRRVEAVACDLNEQLAAQSAVFYGGAQASPNWQPHQQQHPTLSHASTPSQAPSNNTLTRLAAARAATRPQVELFPRGSPPGLDRNELPSATPVHDFADQVLRKLDVLSNTRDKKTTSKHAGDSNDEYRPRVKEAETILVPSWPRADTFSLWIAIDEERQCCRSEKRRQGNRMA